MAEREFTPERITSLRPNEIFVFGSNLGGFHGGGAAELAYRSFGAVWGQGEGLQGQSYALPTIVHTVAEMQPYVGFTVNEVAPLFVKALEVPNIVLPERFFRVLQG